MGALRSTAAITTSHAAGKKSTAAAQAVESVDADAACALLATGQYSYIDVRMWEDFDVGHVTRARNVPYYLSVAPRGRPERNPHFVEQVAVLYGKEDHILVGCRQGVRSRLAAADLVDAVRLLVAD
jgi:rhodanese-related sulfurtransferase